MLRITFGIPSFTNLFKQIIIQNITYLQFKNMINDFSFYSQRHVLPRITHVFYHIHLISNSFRCIYLCKNIFMERITDSLK